MPFFKIGDRVKADFPCGTGRGIAIGVIVSPPAWNDIYAVKIGLDSPDGGYVRFFLGCHLELESIPNGCAEEKRIRQELERELGEAIQFREYWRAEARRYKSMYENLLEVLWLERNKQEVK